MTDPLATFHEWFEEARAAGVEVPEAMTLATADAEGRPSDTLAVIGPMTRGAFWETIAVSDIAAKAQAVARRLVGSTS